MNFCCERFSKIKDSTFSYDIHKDFGLAELRRKNNNVTVWLNGKFVSSFDGDEYVSLLKLRWISANKVMVWIVNGSGLVLSDIEKMERRLGRFSDLLISDQRFAAMYGEYDSIASVPGDIEHNLISMFDPAGTFLFGLRAVMERRKIFSAIRHVTSAYTTHTSLNFVAYGSNLVWKLRYESLDLDHIELPIESGYPMYLFGSADKSFAVLKKDDTLKIVGFDFRKMQVIDLTNTGNTQDVETMLSRQSTFIQANGNGSLSFRHGLNVHLLTASDCL